VRYGRIVHDVDLVVVGAGPTGIAAGLTAHRRGLDVLVVDKATFPRPKTCGDGLTTAALRTFETLGFDASALDGYQPVTDVVVRSPSGRRVDLPLPTTGAYAGIVARAVLDAAFVEHGRQRGVDVRDGMAVVEVTPAADGIATVLDDDTVVRARFVVAADGHFSPVRRLLDPDRPADLGRWHASRQYFARVEDPRLWVLFEPELLPGYAWVFPLPGARANVGFGMRRGAGVHGRDLAARWRALLGSPALRSVLGPDAKPEGSPRAWPIPTGPDLLALTGPRVLFAGDAARVADPMTGEGIAQGLITGVLAAETVATTREDEVGPSYRRAVTVELGRDLRFADLLGRIMTSTIGARGAVRAAGLTTWTRRNFARWLFEDYPRALMFTPARWRSRMLRGPGAYRR